MTDTEEFPLFQIGKADYSDNYGIGLFDEFGKLIAFGMTQETAEMILEAVLALRTTPTRR